MKIDFFSEFMLVFARKDDCLCDVTIPWLQLFIAILRFMQITFAKAFNQIGAEKWNKRNVDKLVYTN